MQLQLAVSPCVRRGNLQALVRVIRLNLQLKCHNDFSRRCCSITDASRCASGIWLDSTPCAPHAAVDLQNTGYYRLNAADPRGTRRNPIRRPNPGSTPDQILLQVREPAAHRGLQGARRIPCLAASVGGTRGRSEAARSDYPQLWYFKSSQSPEFADQKLTIFLGNHAQALALAASTLGVPAYIVMPRISTPSKIAGTQSHGAEVIFSGSTSVEREAVVAEIQAKTDAILVPPYDDFNIICGQGTTALELEAQHAEIRSQPLDAVITPIGGGGLNSGVATWFSDKKTRVFGAEPSFEGADDCRRGLAAKKRVEAVGTLTIADGLRTPVGLINWEVISNEKRVEGVFAVTEEQIKSTMRLVLERMKVVVEPSAVVGLAVCLFDEDFRRRVEKEGGASGWDIGVVFSGGNTTVEAIAKIFA